MTQINFTIGNIKKRNNFLQILTQNHKPTYNYKLIKKLFLFYDYYDDSITKRYHVSLKNLVVVAVANLD